MTRTVRPKLSEETTHLRVCYYGDPGTGKTTAAAAMAKLGPIVVIDTEAGLKAAALRRQGIPTDNIEPVRDVSYPALTELADELQGRTDLVGVVWDSMTASVGSLLSDVTHAAAEKAARQGKVRATYTAQQDDWGDVVAQIRELLRKFRALPVHLALTAHGKRSKDEEGRVRIGPSVSPALQSDLVAYTDAVIRTDLTPVGDSIFRTGLSNPEGKYDAKDRIGAFPQLIVNPGFDRLVAYVEGELTQDSDPEQAKAREASATITPTNTGDDD